MKEKIRNNVRIIKPKKVLEKLGEMGFGAIYTSTEHGGSGLTRLDATIIFEALSTACTSTTAYLSIHNMCVWIIDTFGNPLQKDQFIPSLASLHVLLFSPPIPFSFTFSSYSILLF